MRYERNYSTKHKLEIEYKVQYTCIIQYINFFFALRVRARVCVCVQRAITYLIERKLLNIHIRDKYINSDAIYTIKVKEGREGDKGVKRIK